jgi:putative pyruvate formate lyase activating enzyme
MPERLPGYLRLLESGELSERAGQLEEMLARCTICSWDCGINRLEDETKVCVAGRLPIVSSYAPHFGEEPALSGTHLPRGEARGAGNVFFGHCTLRCVYCQNWQISQNLRQRPANEVSIERLAAMMLELQDQGCHNIGLVSPTHFAPQMARAVEIAARRGLHLPLVYNTNAYDSVEALRLLDGVLDIYLPDLKYADDEAARRYSKAPRYVASARAAIREMYRQVGGAAIYDQRGLLRRGLVIRLLVLPNGLAGLRDSLEWIARELSTSVTLSVMSQYYPSHKAAGSGLYPLLSRKVRPPEFEQVVEWIEELGFENGWTQPLGEAASDYYRPDFSDSRRPFADARDFQ